jgi:hypothetical protein
MIDDNALPPTSRDLLRGYVLPQVVLFLAAALHAAPLAVAALAVIPLVVPGRWLLLNWFGISLINFTLFISGASWLSLLATYYYGAVVATRLRVLDRPLEQIARESRFELAGLAMIVVSFVFVSRGHYFMATAIKSTLQLGFLLLLSILVRQIERHTFQDLRRQLLALLPIHLVVYLVASIVVWRLSTPGDRFGGMLGAQLCGFSLTLVFALFWFAKDKTFAYVALVGVALTGSRTYVGIAAVVIFAPLFATRAKLGTKIAAGIGLVVLMLVGWELLPYLSERFVMNEDFYGTFLGRFLNYENAVDHIHAHPVFGEGMGSMLQVLEDWIPEYFEYYVQSGDTTIVHDEYLRIGMELGFVGLGLAITYLVRAFRGASSEARTMIAVFAIGSLTENTLSLYSTAMLSLLLLVWGARSVQEPAT